MITTQKQSLFGNKWRKNTLSDQNAGGTQAPSVAPLSSLLKSVQTHFSTPRIALPVMYDPIQIEAELCKNGNLSPKSALLGMCEDGLPFVMDFSNPTPGSLLIAGDPGSGKSRLLRSLLDSASRLINPETIQIIRAVESPSSENSAGELDPNIEQETKQSLPDQISALATRIETRKKNPAPNQLIIYVIQDLFAFIASLDKDTLTTFVKVVKHGPRYQIWTIASFSPESRQMINAQILDAFRTHLLCGILDRKAASYVSGDSRLNTRKLEKGMQFYVPYGDRWLRSWICPPSPKREMEAVL